MTNNSSASSGGIGFCGLLTIVFITLKLTHIIAWSWLWVLAPLWVSIVLSLAILFGFGGLAFLGLIISLFVKGKNNKRK